MTSHLTYQLDTNIVIGELIAAIALAHNAVLVTDNTQDFEHIDGLSLENWLR